MSSVAFELLLILLLTIANGVFSGSEIAVVSARKVRLEHLANRGSKKAQMALRLANSPNSFLSSVQIGITLIGTLSGAVGGATLSRRLEEVLRTFPGLVRYSEPLSILIVVTFITYLSLVIGELVPKRIALNNPEKIACSVAHPMHWLAKLTAPVVHLLSSSTDGLLKLLGIQVTEDSGVTEEEIKVLIKQGTQAGMFEEAEQEMVSRVFRLGDRSVTALMTPRTDIVWLDVDAPWELNKSVMLANPHSYFPVGQGSLDECVGIVSLKDLLPAFMAGEVVNLRQVMRSPLFVPESIRALKVLELFKESRNHIALIADEYGGLEGLVTLNDVSEAVIGELPSLEDLNEPLAIKRDDGSWLLDGMLSIDTLKEILQQDNLPSEDEGYYQTLGGFAMHVLGRVPTSGEHFEAIGFRFEIVDMDGNRVDKVMVTPIADSQPADLQ
jgi:putative hemolysin